MTSVCTGEKNIRTPCSLTQDDSKIWFDMFEPRRHQEQTNINCPNGHIMEYTKETGGKGPNTFNNNTTKQ